MTEIQRLLTETIDDLNIREKRDNKPRFSISFIRKHPWLFIGMYVARFATLAVMLQSETLVDSVWLLVVLFVVLNGFFFFDVAPRYRFEDIDVLDFRVCYNGEWYNTRFVPPRSSILSCTHRPWIANIKHSCKDDIAQRRTLVLRCLYAYPRPDHPVTVSQRR